MTAFAIVTGIATLLGLAITFWQAYQARRAAQDAKSAADSARVAAMESHSNLNAKTFSLWLIQLRTILMELEHAHQNGELVSVPILLNWLIMLGGQLLGQTISIRDTPEELVTTLRGTVVQARVARDQYDPDSDSASTQVPALVATRELRRLVDIAQQWVWTSTTSPPLPNEVSEHVVRP